MLHLKGRNQTQMQSFAVNTVFTEKKSTSVNSRAPLALRSLTSQSVGSRPTIFLHLGF